MSRFDQPFDSAHDPQDLVAPPALVEALRRLDSQTVLLTPQMDQTVLDRPLLHLARVRELRAYAVESQTEPEEELALAAHSPRTPQPKASDFSPPTLPSDLEIGRPPWWRPLLLCGAVIFAGSAAVSKLLPASALGTLVNSGLNPLGVPPLLILSVLAIGLFVAWLGAKST